MVLLAGGHRGFNKAIFSVVEQIDGEFPSITFGYNSFDGEQGNSPLLFLNFIIFFFSFIF